MFKKIIILYYYFKTRYFSQFHRGNLEEWQDKEIQKFLKKILPKSKYYSEKYKNLSLNQWQDFPTIDKKEMMENFNSLNTVDISKENAFEIAYRSEQERNFKSKINGITVGLSSGTSGNRGIFLADDMERFKWAGIILAKILPKSIFCKNRIAFFLRANSNLYESVKSNTVKFCYFDMQESVEANLKKLDKFKPTIIIAPPSMLKLIAENYNKISINPQKIISVAEVLDDIDKIFIEKVFKQTVHQVYQATEGFIASTCKYGHLHVNEDILCVQKEYIDEANGKFLPVITDFNRTSQPIIRYRLNDILTESDEPCPCGSKFLRIKKIEGRSDDIFYLKSKDSPGMIPIFPDFLSRAVIYASSEIQEYKIIQNKIDEIEVYIDKKDEFEKVEKSLTGLFKKMNVVVPSIIQADVIQTDRLKKFKRIESKINE